VCELRAGSYPAVVFGELVDVGARIEAECGVATPEGPVVGSEELHVPRLDVVFRIRQVCARGPGGPVCP
ncbi:MAG: hypothetical protein ACXACE_16815, partial [Candidatus Thorarchaeota archaeon]